MNCGVCNRVMRKDIKIDDVPTCHVCKKIWVDNFNKYHNMNVKVIAPYHVK